MLDIHDEYFRKFLLNLINTYSRLNRIESHTYHEPPDTVAAAIILSKNESLNAVSPLKVRVSHPEANA